MKHQDFNLHLTHPLSKKAQAYRRYKYTNDAINGIRFDIEALQSKLRVPATLIAKLLEEYPDFADVEHSRRS